MSLEKSKGSTSIQQQTGCGTTPPMKWAPQQLATGMVIRDSRSSEAAPIPDLGQVAYRPICSGQLDLIVGNLVHQSNYGLEISGPDLLKLCFIRTGSFNLQFDNRHIQTNYDSRCLMVMQPEGMVKRQHNVAGTSVKGVTLAFSPRFLCDDIGIPTAELPTPVRRFLDGKSRDFVFDDYPMSSLVGSCVTQLLDADTNSPLTLLLLEAKSLELIYLFFNSLAQSDFSEKCGMRLSERDRRRLEDVRRLLDDQSADPPSLHELGRLAAMSRSKFAASFKAAFGTSVGEYCFGRRMLRARDLLSEGELPIGAVAFAVGYEHQSSFSVAYRRYFGAAPRGDRLARRLVGGRQFNHGPIEADAFSKRAAGAHGADLTQSR